MPKDGTPRDYYKANTSDLDDPRYQALEMDERGVWHSLLHLQARVSTPQGALLTPFENEPMSAAYIARMLHADPALVERTLSKCQATGLLRQDKKLGCVVVAGWLERYSFASQYAGIRAGNAKRQAEKRAREKAELAALRGEAKVTAMRRRRGDGGGADA